MRCAFILAIAVASAATEPVHAAETPVAPEAVEVLLRGDTAMVSWTDASSTEIGFAVDRRIGESTWTRVAYFVHAPPDREELVARMSLQTGERYYWTDAVLVPAERTCYRVMAWGEHASASSEACKVVPPAPPHVAMKPQPGIVRKPLPRDLFRMGVNDTYACSDPELDRRLIEQWRDLGGSDDPALTQIIEGFFDAKGACSEGGSRSLFELLSDAWNKIEGPAKCTGAITAATAMCAVEIAACLDEFSGDEETTLEVCAEDEFGTPTNCESTTTGFPFLCLVEAVAAYQEWDPCVQTVRWVDDVCGFAEE